MNFVHDNNLNFADDGYRPNVGIVIVNDNADVFWARRVGGDGWQFPQGGIDKGESIVDSLYRELEEETGLLATDVAVIARTQGWLRYDLPRHHHHVQQHMQKVSIFSSSSTEKIGFKGQKQVWFLLKLLNANVEPNFNMSDSPEFDDWCWIKYWDAIERVVDFKRDVYSKALQELAPNLACL